MNPQNIQNGDIVEAVNTRDGLIQGQKYQVVGTPGTKEFMDLYVGSSTNRCIVSPTILNNPPENPREGGRGLYWGYWENLKRVTT